MSESPANEPFEVLIGRWCAGDQAAAEVILERTLPWVRAVVRSKMGAELRRKDETLDIVQEALFEFLRYGQRFEVATEENFRALLSKIVSNVLSDRYAWFTRRRRDIHREQVRLGQTSVRIEPIGTLTDPAHRAEKSENIELMRLALELLPPGDRDVIVRREYDGETFEAIAASLGQQPDAVRKRFHRALPKLSDCMRQLQNGKLESILSD